METLQMASPVVETASGKVRGATENGIHLFKGIPYGAPTGGPNRFMPPRPPKPWAGIRAALIYAGHAPQWQAAPTRRAGMATLLGPVDETPVTEDCLSLNVWTPGLGETVKRPVMVWLHGGAFHFGSANRAVTAGANLARRGDVVVVSVNHRLNILGHFDLSEIGGAEYAHSGNGGLLDLITALEWVRDNIGRFGGDARNVTIFGESGGGGKVSALSAMPAARGLFHRAVIQSGAAIRFSTKERAAALTEAALQQLGVTRVTLTELHQLPVEQLIAAITPAKQSVGKPLLPLLDRYDFGPVIDGADLPSHPCDPDAPELSDEIPLLIGDTKDEATRFLVDDDAVWERSLDEAELQRRLQALAGADAGRVLDFYRTRDPRANPAELLIAAATGAQFWIRSVLYAERKAARARAPVFMYSLAWETPISEGRLKTPHALDLPFVFDNTEIADATRGAAGARELSALMAASWAAFARSGDPAIPGLPDWPGYRADNRVVMVFDSTCSTARNPDADARSLWSRVATQSKP
jgi:para-nitrobenzyl esterase